MNIHRALFLSITIFAATLFADSISTGPLVVHFFGSLHV